MKRELNISSRHVRNSINTMMQRDPVKALIELITNSDDSYARLEEAEEPVTGYIWVDVIEKRGGEPSVLRVTDEAEGFTAEELERKLGTMGESTSGLEHGSDVRGFFGEGLKEAILGLGDGGRVTSIRNGKLVSAELYWEGKKAMFELVNNGKPRQVTRTERNKLQLPKNGTVVEIRVAPEIRVPRHETLQSELSLHVSLRDLVQSQGGRQLMLRRLNSSGSVVHADYISYKEPVVDPEFKPFKAEGKVPGYRGASFTLEVKRAQVELSGQEEGMKRTGGLVVQSRRALVDITLFSFENRPGTERLFGRLRCDYLYDLLRQDEMTVTKYRAGLAKDNPFVKKLAAEVDKLLAPIVKEEASRLQQSERPEDPQTRKRLEEARRELNKIARELELTGTDDDETDASVPFRFKHNSYRVFLNEKKPVQLVVKSELLTGPVELPLSFPTTGLAASPSVFRLDPAETVNGVVTAEVILEGKALLESGTLSVRLEGHEARAGVVVVERVLPDNPFAFERESYRATVAQWYDVVLRIHVPRMLPSRSEVVFSVESGEIKIRPEADAADPAQARDGWVMLRAQVYGDQVGQKDTIIATMNGHTARAVVTISSQRKPPEPQDKGGLIKGIRFDEERQNPPQRTFFSDDGIITIYANEQSVRRYLQRVEDRNLPAGRALTAELVLQAFCRHAAQRQAESVFDSADMGDSTTVVLRKIDSLIKQFGERIHSIINPR